MTRLLRAHRNLVPTDLADLLEEAVVLMLGLMLRSRVRNLRRKRMQDCKKVLSSGPRFIAGPRVKVCLCMIERKLEIYESDNRDIKSGKSQCFVPPLPCLPRESSAVCWVSVISFVQSLANNIKDSKGPFPGNITPDKPALIAVASRVLEFEENPL